MKTRFFAAFLMILCILFAFTVSAQADFGGYTGGSDYSSSSYYADGADSFSLVFSVVLLGIMALFAFGNKSSKSGTEIKPIDNYSEIDPDFSAEALCARAAKLYVQMQNGWTAKNIEFLRPFFDDAIFNQMEGILRQYVARGETNIVDRITVLDVTPIGFRQTDKEDHILLRLHTRITDYTIRDRDGRIVNGSSVNELLMTYQWDMSRPIWGTSGEMHSADRFTCPRCGAALSAEDAYCPKCGSLIYQPSLDWVISEIRGSKQNTR